MSLGGRPVALHPELASRLDPVKPMGALRRLASYGADDQDRLTGPQARRFRHKLYRDMATRAGERTRGPAFTPASAAEPATAWRPAEGSILDTYAQMTAAAEKPRGRIRTRAVQSRQIRRGESRAR
jgi:hypothetical protein